MNRILGFAMIALVLAAGAAGFYYGYWLPQQDELPRLAITDINDQRLAAKLERSSGKAFKRMHPGEDKDSEWDTDGWQEIGPGDGLLLGTAVRVEKGGSFTYQSAGNWVIVMDGPGEFIFEDAKRTTDSGTRSVIFHVRRGLLRLKPHTSDTKTVHWAQITTQNARIVVNDGEIGIEVSSAGDGKAWLMDGRGVVFKPDGTRVAMGLRGLTFL